MMQDKMMQDKIICGDAVVELAKMPDSTVDLAVFSPPYDGLCARKKAVVNISCDWWAQNKRKITFS